MDTAHKVGELAQNEGYELRCMGVPKTVDNDLGFTDHCPGYGSVARWNAMATRDAGRDTEAIGIVDNVKIIETMGRNSGYLALVSGIAGGSEMVLIPEVETTFEEITEMIENAYIRGKAHCIIVDAEGWKPGTQVVDSQLQERQEELGFSVRVTQLGHVQRGGSASAFDRLLATRLGAAAVQILLNGQSGVMMGMIKNTPGATPLEEAVAFQKELNLELYELARIMEQ